MSQSKAKALHFVCISVILFLAALPSLTVASTYEEALEQQKDFKMRQGIPVPSILYVNPYGTPSAVEKLILLRAAALENPGAHPMSYQKKFDSLSGGTFGVQKRQSQYSPFE